MAVYYIDPYTTSNGTGTWASPYSFASSGRTALANGDEMRVVSRYLTDLLTATTYTVRWTAVTQMTVTAGGGLGVDFATGDWVYFPDTDTFARVNSRSSNILTAGIWPYYNTTSGLDITMRKVDLAVALPSTTGTNNYLCAALANNVTVTDGWVADGVRVTDGTAKSLVRTSSSGGATYRLDNSPNQSFTGVVYDLANTHFLTSSTTSANTIINIAAGGPSTYTIGQLYANNISSNGNIAVSTQSNIVRANITLTIKNFAGGSPFGSCYATKSNFTIDNMASGGGPLSPTLDECTVTIGNIFYPAGTIVAASPNSQIVHRKTDYVINGVLDCFGSLASTFVVNATGAYKITFGPSSIFYSTRRTGTVTNWLAFYQPSSMSEVPVLVPLPEYTLPAGLSVTTPYRLNAGNIFSPVYAGAGFKQPGQFCLVAPTDTAASKPAGCLFSANITVTHSDGSAPYEVLGVRSTYNSFASASELPVLALDSAVYRTTGPSLQAYLATRSSSYYNAPSFTDAIKNIKVPVTAGQSYTIAGYIRTDQTSYANGDCRVSIVNTYNEVVGQDMTTACINAWEQFSLTFTATKTEELSLAWEMYFAEGAKSFWLDDLTIT